MSDKRKLHAAAPDPQSPAVTKRPLLTYLRGRLASFTPTERLIAERVLADPEHVIMHSIVEFREAIGVSNGSVVGFCRSLDLKGFGEFKITLARELAQAALPEPTLSDASLFESVFDLHRRSLADTLRANTNAAFEQTAAALHSAREVQFFAMGFSWPIAYTASLKLMVIGRPAFAQADAHMQLIAATQLKAGDVAFGISCSGMTHETVRCLEVARARGATTISLTNTMGSAITKHSDMSLYATPGDVKYFKAPLASRVTQLAVIDALFVWLATADKAKAADRLQASADELLRRQQR